MWKNLGFGGETMFVVKGFPMGICLAFAAWLLCKTHSHGLQFISKRSQQIISHPPSPNQILKERLRSIQKIGNKRQLPTTMYPNLAVEIPCYSHRDVSFQHGNIAQVSISQVAKLDYLDYQLSIFLWNQPAQKVMCKSCVNSSGPPYFPSFSIIFLQNFQHFQSPVPSAAGRASRVPPAPRRRPRAARRPKSGRRAPTAAEAWEMTSGWHTDDIQMTWSEKNGKTWKKDGKYGVTYWWHTSLVENSCRSSVY